MDVKGLSFPFGYSDQSGRVQSSDGIAQIESCVKLLLTVDKGSRPMMRDYGVGLSILLQEPNDEVMQNLTRRLIYEEIVRWEPRIQPIDVQFTVDEDLGILRVDLTYALLDTGEQRVMNFDFSTG